MDSTPLPTSRSELPYGGNIEMAIKETDMPAIRLIQRFNTAALIATLGEDSDSDDNDGTLDHADCVNDIDYFTQKPWGQDNLPSIKIYFQTDGRENVQCYNLDSLQDQIENHEVRLWVPNARHQSDGEAIEPMGYGGMPSIIEKFVILSDHTMITKPTFELEENKEYTGTYIYSALYGNKYGTFGIGESHGQGIDKVYLLSPRGDEKASLEDEYLRQAHMRGATADYNNIEELAAAHPVPLEDKGREGIAVSQEEYDEHVRNTFGIEEDSSDDDGEDEDTRDLINMIDAVVHLLRDDYSLIFNTREHTFILFAPEETLRSEILSAILPMDATAEQRSEAASEASKIISGDSDEYTHLDPSEFLGWQGKRHLSSQQVDFLYKVYQNDPGFREAISDVHTYSSALPWSTLHRMTPVYLETSNHILLFEKDAVTWRWIGKFYLDDAVDDLMEITSLPEDQINMMIENHAITSEKFRIMGGDNNVLSNEQIDILYNNMMPEYMVTPLLQEYVSHDIEIEIYIGDMFRSSEELEDNMDFLRIEYFTHPTFRNLVNNYVSPRLEDFKELREFALGGEVSFRFIRQ